MKTFILAIIAFTFTFTLTTNLFTGSDETKARKKPKNLTAGKSLSDWFAARSFPGIKINQKTVSEGFNSMKQSANSRNSSLFTGSWEVLGPMNFGGRTLSLCFNPLNPNTIFAGAAAGGLWKSISAGTGVNAWQQIETGFPVLGVAAIAINPLDSNEIYIGTGEVYNDQNTGTGFAVRTTRGTYGIGLLKTTDGGANWSKSIDWQFDDLRGIQDIIINPLNPNTLLAATTEGTFKTLDAGQNWVLVHNSRMASDLLMIPGDTSQIFLSAGNSFSPNPGIFKSTDGGSSFIQITNGLPATFSGKAMMDVCISNTQIMYASIGEQLTGLGLYKSINGGSNWFQVNPTDFQTYQGWYSHDVVVKPTDPNIVIACGIDVWKSTNGGATLDQKTYWYNWDFDNTNVGGPEGPPDYVHADIHRMYYHPTDDEIIYLATDGGVFRSTDGGDSFEGCNGGYHTQQFYANFSCSSTDSLFAIGGMQDNATAVYEGNDGWRRVIGGDGLSTAIHPVNDQIVYGSSQYLNVDKSTDKAQNFNGINIPGSGTTNFAGPFVLCPSSPNILYGGRDIVYKSVNAGQSWTATNGNAVLDGNAVLVLEVADNNPDIVYAATAPVNVPQVGLFRTTNGGNSWTNVTAGIPNRYIMDIAIDPLVNTTVYVTLSGFGTPHLFRSLNSGTTWTAFGTGLPDIPANTITIDPLNTSIMYLGNDIGIYVSIDGGQNWQPFNDGLIDATFVMDISISPFNRKLRLATHGKGIYERDMLPVTITAINEISPIEFYFSPNPVIDQLTITIPDIDSNTQLKVFNVKGEIIKVESIKNAITKIDLSAITSGIYFIQLRSKGTSRTEKFVKM